MPALSTDRQQWLLRKAKGRGGVGIREAAERLGVSEMTVRRDLHALAAQGLVERVHGGAVSTPSATFDARLRRQHPAKGRAAEKLARFLPREGSIYLDGSTTMLHLLPRLSGARALQVTTNHLETFRQLSALPGVEPLLVGGRLDRRTDNLVGALALRSLLAIAFDAAFFSAWGLAGGIGPVEMTLEDAEVKELAASRARRIYLAVDASKLGVTASGVWLPEKGKTTLATDLAPAEARLDAFRPLVSTIL